MFVKDAVTAEPVETGQVDVQMRVGGIEFVCDWDSRHPRGRSSGALSASVRWTSSTVAWRETGARVLALHDGGARERAADPGVWRGEGDVVQANATQMRLLQSSVPCQDAADDSLPRLLDPGDRKPGVTAAIWSLGVALLVALGVARRVSGAPGTPVRRLLFCTSIAIAASEPRLAAADDVVFDSLGPLGSLVRTAFEWGQELELAADAGLAAQVLLRVGQFEPQGVPNDTILRVYANDGEGGAPGSFLAEKLVTAYVLGEDGTHLLDIDVAQVPDRFTVSVELLEGEAYVAEWDGAPSVGAFRGQWLRLPGNGWSEFPASAIRGFQVRVHAVPEPSSAACAAVAAIALSWITSAKRTRSEPLVRIRPSSPRSSR